MGSSILARGALELIWDSCYESGDEYVGTSADIEALVGWTGEAGVLTRALVDAGVPEGFGFLEPVGNATGAAEAYRVHDLWHHAPDYVAKRRRRELDRQGKVDPGGVRRTAPNGAGKSDSPDRQAGVDRTPSPSHSPSPPPSHKSVSAEADASTSVLTFPTVGTGPKEWFLTSAQVEEWSGAYPGMDIEAEARKALAWVNANKGHRKTAGGMARFLVSWLNRAANDGRGRRQGPSAVAMVGSTAFEWVCPHTPECGGRNACHVKQQIERAKAS